MSDTTLQDARERQAREEVGETKIRRTVALVLSALFLLVVGAVPLVEVLHDIANPRATDTLSERLSRIVHTAVSPLSPETAPSLVSRIVAKNRALIRELERIADEAEDLSLLGRWLRPPTQYLLVRLGAGNEEVYPGGEGWLFYRVGIDYVIGPDFLEPRRLARRLDEAEASGASPHPDPRPAILDLKEQLDARGIRLVLLPTPVKPSIHAERFVRRFEDGEDPLRPSSYASFLEELQREGVLVFDAAPALLEAKRRAGRSYLATDTHWRPEAMELVAERLRDFLTRHVELPPATPPSYASERVEVENQGDLARMLDLPAWQERYSPERVAVRRIHTAGAARWRPSSTADVLLLGDSFTNIYSIDEMGWGTSAGLAEQLSFLLDRPIDRITRNDHGAFATRELLARELARGRDRLEGKRVVIFQFAERELAVGDWRLVDLTPPEAPPGRFFVPDGGGEVVITGTIREIAPIPRPGTVPYADHITAAHLIDIASEHEGAVGAEAVVYMWGMRDHELQEAARYRAGDRITLRVRPWADVADEYDAIQRTEVANETARFEEPAWGEVIP